MKHIKETEYYKKKGFPHDYHALPSPNTVQTIFWWAITPTGRISKWWETLHFSKQVSDERLENAAKNVNHVRLPKGYSWSEPCLLRPL